MNKQQISQTALELFKEQFPEYPVWTRESSEEEGGIEIVAFAVETKDLDKVENFILDLDNIFCAGTDIMIIPILWDYEATKKYYPDKLAVSV